MKLPSVQRETGLVAEGERARQEARISKVIHRTVAFLTPSSTLSPSPTNSLFPILPVACLSIYGTAACAAHLALCVPSFRHGLQSICTHVCMEVSRLVKAVYRYAVHRSALHRIASHSTATTRQCKQHQKTLRPRVASVDFSMR